MIYVCSAKKLPQQAKILRPSHVITLMSAEYHPPTPQQVAPEQHLKLDLHDIVEDQPGHIAPDEDHIHELLGFVADWDASAPLLIHCWAGVSRSMAAAYIVMCLHNEGLEQEAADIIAERAPHAEPNRRLVALADNILQRDGRMIDAVAPIFRDHYTLDGPVVNLPHRL